MLVPPPALDRAPAPEGAALTTDLKTLADAANEAAKREATQWFFLVTLMVYLAVAVGSTTHRVLFLESPVQLPVFNVPVPLLGFYWLAPALLVVMHFYLLAQIRVMAGKVTAFLDAAEAEAGEDRAALRLAVKRLDPFPVAQLLAAARLGEPAVALRGMVWTTLVVAPVALLLFVQIRFLPYHDEATTWWHRAMVLADLGLLWWLWPFAGAGGQAGSSRRWRTAIAFGVSWLVVFFTVAVAIIPPLDPPRAGADAMVGRLAAWLFDGEPDQVSQRPTSPFSRSLVLPDEDFVPEDDTAREAMLRTRVLRGRDLRYAVLDRADLRKADLTGARLDQASLRGARLEHATFDGARLGDAKLDEARASHASFACVETWSYRGCARLDAASLRSAKLQGTSFQGAQMPGATLVEAEMQGASLSEAALYAADLTSADLTAATLSGAQLHGAWLSKAVLVAAQFETARMPGAQFSEAKLQGASFAFKTWLDVTGLWRASAEGAVFLHTHLPEPVGDYNLFEPLPPEFLTAEAEAVLSQLDPRGEAHRRVRFAFEKLERPLSPLEEESWRKTWPVVPEALGVFDVSGLAALLLDVACDASQPAPVLAGILRRVTDTTPFGDSSHLGDATAGFFATLLDAAQCPRAATLTTTERTAIIRIRSALR